MSWLVVIGVLWLAGALLVAWVLCAAIRIADARERRAETRPAARGVRQPGVALERPGLREGRRAAQPGAAGWDGDAGDDQLSAGPGAA